MDLQNQKKTEIRILLFSPRHKNMALPAPSRETLLKAIDALDTRGDGFSCCRNCYSVSTDVRECRDCNVFRCESCQLIYETASLRLATYLFLGLKLGHMAGVSLAEACRNDVMTCSRCGNDYCTGCRVIREGKKYSYFNMGQEKFYTAHICSKCWKDNPEPK